MFKKKIIDAYARSPEVMLSKTTTAGKTIEFLRNLVMQIA